MGGYDFEKDLELNENGMMMLMINYFLKGDIISAKMFTTCSVCNFCVHFVIKKAK